MYKLPFVASIMDREFMVAKRRMNLVNTDISFSYDVKTITGIFISSSHSMIGAKVQYLQAIQKPVVLLDIQTRIYLCQRISNSKIFAS